MYIVKLTYPDALKYDHKVLYKRNGKYKRTVYLGIICTSEDLSSAADYYRRNENVLYLLYHSSLSGLPVLYGMDFKGINISILVEVSKEELTEKWIEQVILKVPVTVSVVFRMPQGYSDLRYLSALCKRYKNIRFTGGYLFAVNECRFGFYWAEELEKRGIAYQLPCILNEDADIFSEVKEAEVSCRLISDLNLKDNDKSNRKSFKDILLNKCT